MTDQLPEQEPESKSTGMTRVRPPMYTVLRAGSQAPDPLRAESDEEAWATIQRQVRSGQVGTIHLYKMIGAELYEPSSIRLSVEDVEAGRSLPPAKSLDNK